MICVSISDKDFNKCLGQLQKVNTAEIRLDMTELSAAETAIIFALKKKLIATCRPGKFSDAERLEILRYAIAAGAAMVDIEYESEPAYRNGLIEFAHENQCDVIISYHNFNLTPEIEELEEIVRNSFAMGADVAKIATMVKQNRDNSKLLSLYHLPGRLISIGMGELGKITRIVAPFLGAEFTFAAPDDGEPTAPGQISLTKLHEFIIKIQKL